jgi:heme oxygenase
LELVLSPSVEEAENVMKFMNETTAQWRNLSVEVRSVRSMLEEVISNWDRYGNTVASLQAWLEDAEKMLNQSENAKKVREFHIKEKRQDVNLERRDVFTA